MTIVFLACWLAGVTPEAVTCERVEIRMEPDASPLYCELVKQQATAAWLSVHDGKGVRLVEPPRCERGERT